MIRIGKGTATDAFTMVELLVVLAIIALVTTIAAPQVLRYLGTAKADTAQAQIRSISSAMELYYLDVGAYPSDDEGIAALAVAPATAAGWNGPYMKGAEKLADPWGAAYTYEADGETFKVGSLGRDGKVGGAGLDQDLAN